MVSFEVLEFPVREKIIKEFLRKKDILKFKYIKEFVNHSRPDYHLDKLVESKLLEHPEWGIYRLNLENIQSLREKYKIKTPICLIGGLGENLDLYSDILDKLKSISIIPRKYIILTSPKINKKFEEKSFKEDFKKKYDVETELHLFKFEEELKSDLDKIQEVSENLIRDHIYDFEIITELTGGTKLITMALFILADKYNLDKIYFNGKEIKWLN